MSSLARASTETEAANAALRLIGVAAIADINRDTKSLAARECRAAFGDARDETLRQKQWNFATAWSTLPKLDTPSQGPLKNAYAIPDDCVRVLRVYGLSTDEWALETVRIQAETTLVVDQTVLVSNASTALVSYTRRIVDVVLWDVEFLAAFALRLAGKVASPLSREFTIAADLEALATARTDKAARTDAKEKAPSSFTRNSSWIGARRI